MRAGRLVVWALLAAFVLTGSQAWAQGQDTEKNLKELEASGKAAAAELEKALGEVKRVAAELESDPTMGVNPDVERRLREAAEKVKLMVGISLEVTSALSLMTTIEKWVEKQGADTFSVAAPLLAERFKTDVASITKLREKGYTIVSIVMGYALAQATNNMADKVFDEYEKQKTWVVTALKIGVKPDEVTKVLKTLMQQ